jgi:glycosyltransferase involved in cell wall biosynthesis
LFNASRRDPDWRRKQGWTDEDVVVLWLGRLVLEKGVEVYVNILRALSEQGQRVRPLIVGAGPAEDRFRALQDAVLTGHLEGTDLALAVASADLMINPSVTETFGNVLLEAMASGLPVISADAPNARALIDNGRTGILCTPQDPQDYVGALIRLIENPEERSRIGAAARAASDAYSWDAASAAVEQAYLRTVGDYAQNRREGVA